MPRSKTRSALSRSCAEQGLIRHIGLSNVTADQLAAARQIVDIAAVTAHFNVVARRAGRRFSSAALEAALPSCRGSRYR